jgi:hypothetical protein
LPAVAVDSASAATEPEIEITEEMIEAGEMALIKFNPLFESEKDAVARIFLAMSRLRHHRTTDPSANGLKRGANSREWTERMRAEGRLDPFDPIELTAERKRS